MSYVGDIRLGDTIDIKFCTVTTTGAPTTLAGTPVLSAYPGNSVTQLTAGITLSVDFDGVTGLNNVRVVATSGNGYATATNYSLVITTGTVGGTSVVGYVVGEFSIEARSAVMPTTAARTLDVSATGEAGVDWANVGSPTTTLALTGTTIASTQQVDVNTIKTQAVTAAAGVTFPSSVASPTNITAGTITTVTNLTNAATAGDFTATMKTSIGTAVAASAVASVTGNVGGNVTGSVGSVVGLTASNLDATISSRASAANLATLTAYVDTEVASILTIANKLDTAMELNTGVYRFTTAALALAPSGGLDAAGVRAAVGLASANLDTQLAAIQADTDNLQTRIPAALIGGRMDASVGAMAANVMTAAAAAPDLTTELQTGLSTLDAAGVRAAVGLASANLDAQLTAIDDYIDSEVAAIKAKTDQLTFTSANQVDAAIKRINLTPVIGNGAGTPWGP